MCYFLYGGINEDINLNDLSKIKDNNFTFKNVSNDMIVTAITKSDWTFRITNNHCDCDSGIGSQKTSKKDLAHFIKYLSELRTVRNIKYIYLAKKWTDTDIEKDEVEIHIDDIDDLSFFANLRENTIYKINLFKKYY